MTYCSSRVNSRLSQLTRHFPRSQANISCTPLTTTLRPNFGSTASRVMTSTNLTLGGNARIIHTAACLIIGDEVLGGKVCLVLIDVTTELHTDLDYRRLM